MEEMPNAAAESETEKMTEYLRTLEERPAAPVTQAAPAETPQMNARAAALEAIRKNAPEEAAPRVEAAATGSVPATRDLDAIMAQVGAAPVPAKAAEALDTEKPEASASAHDAAIEAALASIQEHEVSAASPAAPRAENAPAPEAAAVPERPAAAEPQAAAAKERYEQAVPSAQSVVPQEISDKIWTGMGKIAETLPAETSPEPPSSPGTVPEAPLPPLETSPAQDAAAPESDDFERAIAAAAVENVAAAKARDAEEAAADHAAQMAVESRTPKETAPSLSDEGVRAKARLEELAARAIETDPALAHGAAASEPLPQPRTTIFMGTDAKAPEASNDNASLSPEEVEEALKKGEAIEIPEAAPAPAPAEADVSAGEETAASQEPEAETMTEIPGDADRAAQAEALASRTEADGTASGSEALREREEFIPGSSHSRSYETAASIELREGFRLLGMSAKSFVRDLYASAPASAVRALGWRLSIGFNDRLARYYESKADAHGAVMRAAEEDHDSLKREQAEQEETRSRLTARFGNDALSPRVRKQIEKEDADRSATTDALEDEAFEAGMKAMHFDKKREAYETKRRAAAEKFARYAESRLAPFEKGIEALHEKELAFDEQSIFIERAREEAQLDRDRIFIEANQDMSRKPESERMIWTELFSKADARLAGIDALLDRRAEARARLDMDIRLLEAKADRWRMPAEAASRSEGAEAGEHAGAESDEPAADSPEIFARADDGPAYESFGTRDDSIRITVGEYVTAWNTYFGSWFPVRDAYFSRLIDAPLDDEMPVDALDRSLEGYMYGGLAARKYHGMRGAMKRMAQDSDHAAGTAKDKASMRRGFEAFRTYLRRTYAV